VRSRSDEKGRPGPLGARAGLIFECRLSWMSRSPLSSSPPSSIGPPVDAESCRSEKFLKTQDRQESQESSGSGCWLLCSCQGGAEAALRQRAAELLPAARPGVWRRGVVTFRLPDAAGPEAGPVQGKPAAGNWPELVFARTTIQSLGQVSGVDDPARETAAIAAARQAYHNVHVWKRDPKADLPVAAIRAGLLAACGLDPVAELAKPGDRVLDCVLDSADRWWIGWHDALEPASCWPGGLYLGAVAQLPAGKISRAWLKLDEAIALFGISFEPGQQAMELGAAPGGVCQRLLESGLEVVGVDPAVVDERVAADAHFHQLRMRARDVPLRRCGRIDWLLSDMNIDPASTMAALGRIATAPAVGLRGIVATLKLPDWSRAAELSSWLEMFRLWGFEPRARQLSTGGREICVVALRPEPPPPGTRRPQAGKVSRRPATRRPGR